MRRARWTSRAFLKKQVVRKLMALDPELREAFRSAVLTKELLPEQRVGKEYLQGLIEYRRSQAV